MTPAIYRGAPAIVLYAAPGGTAPVAPPPPPPPPPPVFVAAAVVPVGPSFPSSSHGFFGTLRATYGLSANVARSARGATNVGALSSVTTYSPSFVCRPVLFAPLPL
eukprot:29403-Pelagococcus_subviridis.AAC.1